MASSRRTLLLMDANVLIDFCATRGVLSAKKRAAKAKAKARMEAMLVFFVSRSAAESLHKLVR